MTARRSVGSAFFLACTGGIPGGSPVAAIPEAARESLSWRYLKDKTLGMEAKGNAILGVLAVVLTVALGLLVPGSGARAEPMAAGGAGFIAGLQPDRRPAGAPVIKQVRPLATGDARALTGLVEPRGNLSFLADQGVWYTPFTRPNLKGRYDLRGFHAAAGEGRHE